eukprot:4613453-Prymnesium_polylepis.1
MDRLGGEEKGFEQIRKPTPDPTDFNPTFELHTPEHRAWLEAADYVSDHNVRRERSQSREHRTPRRPQYSQ